MDVWPWKESLRLFLDHFAAGSSGSESSSRYSNGSEGLPFRVNAAFSFRFSRTSEVVETVVAESSEDRGEEVELRCPDELEGESWRRWSFSGSRRSWSFGDMVAALDNCVSEVQGSWEPRSEVVVANRGDEEWELRIQPRHSGPVRVLEETVLQLSTLCVEDEQPKILRVLSVRRRGLSGVDAPAFSRQELSTLIGCCTPILHYFARQLRPNAIPSQPHLHLFRPRNMQSEYGTQPPLRR